MTVGELRELLKGFDADRIVIMAKDGEGNSYSPLYGAWTGKYRAETTWFGDVGLEGLDEELRERGYTESDVMIHGVPALILSPTN